METISFHVNYKNTVYTYHSGTEAMIFDYGVNNEINRKHGLKALTEYVSFVYELYLSDSNDTPLGTLCDFLAKHWKKLRNKSRYEILEKFYLTI